MFKEKAHDISAKIRTQDVIISDDMRFKDLLLSPDTLKGLDISGFRKPSPIQKKAIPLGRCGFDMIVQAKSGTGKTCVFAVIALEMLQWENDKLQVLILSPTREISFQIKEVISSIGQGYEKLKVSEFIGGTPLNSDKVNIRKCQIAVGTPGRVKHLISTNVMKLDSVRLFVIDEADRLMEDNFRKDVSFIYLKLPQVKQSIAVSATFPPSLEEFVTQYMSNPVRIKAGTEVFLLGIRQFVTTVPSHMSAIVQFNNKLRELARILSSVPFNQCLIFSNYLSRGESICSMLKKLNWPAVCINGSQQQKTRLETISCLKNFRFRVLVSTDLTSRGIDAENINLVVNLDLPYDSVTYMHRIGRAGRYGTPGLAVTIVEEGSELIRFQKMLNEIGGESFSVSLLPKGEINFDVWEVNDEHFEQIFSADGEYENFGERKHEEKEEPEEEVEEEEIKEFQGNAPKVEKEVEFVDKVNCDRSRPEEYYNLKTYAQLLKLMKDYKKPVERTEPSNTSFSVEKFSLDKLAEITSLDACWKNFKRQVEVPKTDEPEVRGNSRSSQNHKNSYHEPGPRERMAANGNPVEVDRIGKIEEEENSRHCSSSSVSSNKTKYITANNINSLPTSTSGLPYSGKGPESVQELDSEKDNRRGVENCSNNSNSYLNGEKDTIINDIENEGRKEDLEDTEEESTGSSCISYSNSIEKKGDATDEEDEEEEEEESDSIGNYNNFCFYSNEDITTNNIGDNVEDEIESEEEDEEEEEEEESDCDSDPCDDSSVVFRNWYSLFYLQMFTVRQYTTYLKQFNYYNELFSHLRK